MELNTNLAIEKKSLKIIISFIKKEYSLLFSAFDETQRGKLDLIVYSNLDSYSGYAEQSNFIVYCVDYLKQAMGDDFPLKVQISVVKNITGELQTVYNVELKNKDIVGETEDSNDQSKNYTKVKTSEPVLLLLKLNYSISGELNHPIRDELMKKANQRIDLFERLLKAHILSLEETYPQYEDFFYEFDSDSRGSWYNLMGKGI